MKKIIFCCIFFATHFCYAQKFQHQILGGIAYDINKPSIFNTAKDQLQWHNITYNSQWFELGLGMAQLATLSTNSFATKATDLRLGLNFPLKKLIVGKRKNDIKGLLLVPSMGAHYIHTRVQESAYNYSKANGLRLNAMASLQLPFCAIDARLNVDLRQNKSSYIKPTAIYPSLAVRLDGLYHVFDPSYGKSHTVTGVDRSSRIVGSSTTRSTNTEYSPVNGTTTTTTTRTTSYIEVIETPYSTDVYTNSIEAFVGIGPRYSVGRYTYAGSTNMAGIGVYTRASIFGIDGYVEFGKIGAASSAKGKVNIGGTQNKTLGTYDIDKTNYLMSSQLNATKIGVDFSIEALSILGAMSSKGAGINSNKTKFTRWYFGIGGGYALIGKANYTYTNGEALANAAFDASTMEKSSQNDARYSKPSGYFEYFTALEVGALQIAYAQAYYPNVYLARMPYGTVSYMIPWRKLMK